MNFCSSFPARLLKTAARRAGNPEAPLRMAERKTVPIRRSAVQTGSIQISTFFAFPAVRPRVLDCKTKIMKNRYYKNRCNAGVANPLMPEWKGGKEMRDLIKERKRNHREFYLNKIKKGYGKTVPYINKG